MFNRPRWVTLVKGKASSSGISKASQFLDSYIQALKGLVNLLMKQGEPEEDTERWDQLNDLAEACLRVSLGKRGWDGMS